MMLQTGLKRGALIAAISLAGLSNANAAIRTWSSIASTDYNTAANWTTAVAPNGADEYSMGAVGTVDALMSASATVNGVVFTNGRNVTLDTSTFVLTVDGGAATDISVTGSGADHVINGGDAVAAHVLLSATGNYIMAVAPGSSLRINTLLAGPASGNTSTRFLKDALGVIELSADSSATWKSVGNPGALFTPVTTRAGVLKLSSVGAKGANTNSVSVYQSTAAGNTGSGGGTIQLTASLVFDDFGGTNSTQGFLEMSGRGYTGGVDATGEGSLRVISGNNTITTSNGTGDVRFANNGDVGENAVRIRVDSGASLAISAPIVNGALFQVTVPNLEKMGSGLLTFDTAAKTYTGNTTVMEGSLRVNASYTGGGAFTVNSGATLGGTGGIGASSVTINAGGFLAPGASIESLDVGSATGAGTLLVEYDGDAGADLVDLLNVSGNLNITNMAVDFDLIPLGDTLDDSAIVFAKYGTLGGSAFAAQSDVPAGYVIDYAYNDGASTNNIALVQVPEPASIALCVLAFCALGLNGRRRQRK